MAPRSSLRDASESQTQLLTISPNLADGALLQFTREHPKKDPPGKRIELPAIAEKRRNRRELRKVPTPGFAWLAREKDGVRTN